ncbi:TGS domain-containing protein [Sulfolobus sp. S-194]|uniref:TGS domain-containing protein n=1 Tax=Sulfolobus sp. S-194 TaxID=2512240 RepID=UPI00143709FD|nr:TGS domain-containing protein [Sulfolobus sp. S-194]QIW23383.1 TGS domain-containing protein [Sulfolobus sp. S-194]
MVTNLPAEAKAKWLKYMDAKTTEEKIKALQEFLSAVPKHKGTENLVYWAKRRLAELKEEAQLEKKKSSSLGKGLQFFIEKEGAGQVVLLGNNELRNKLMKILTNVKNDPKELPVPGMMEYQDIKIQLINPPPLIFEARALVGKVLGLVKNADSLLIVVKDREEFFNIRDFLENNGIYLKKPKGKVIIDRSRYGNSGIRIVLLGKLIGTNESEVKNYLESFGIKNALVKILGEVTLDDIEKEVFETAFYKQAIIATQEPFSLSDIVVVSLFDIDKLKEAIFRSLDIIRVYTKEPGEKPTSEPLTLKRGSTVIDVARKLHNDLAENFKYARVWGKSVKFQGQKVGADYVLEDGDVVEIHVK